MKALWYLPKYMYQLSGPFLHALIRVQAAVSIMLFLGYVQSAHMNDSCLRKFQLQKIFLRMLPDHTILIFHLFL
jgi:hypothetical protein